MKTNKKIQNVFDLALKQVKGGNPNNGYAFCDGRVYNAYYTKNEWLEFLNNMEHNHNKAFHEFKDGKGRELEERRSKSGKMMPPKMASYASSSRFFFEISKDLGDDFTYECELPIAFRGFGEEAKASLDGYLVSKRLFVEAKCREIYSGLSSEYKPSYKSFYDYMKKCTNGRLEYFTTLGKNKEYVNFKWDGTELKTLDLKQLLCHMLGIGKKALQEDSHNVSTLIYLVFYPNKDLLTYIQNEDDRKLILEIWKNEKKEAESIDFKLLYKLIVQYLFNKKKSWQKNRAYSSRVEEISNAFDFKFCNQRPYLNVVNKVPKIK